MRFSNRQTSRRSFFRIYAFTSVLIVIGYNIIVFLFPTRKNFHVSMDQSVLLSLGYLPYIFVYVYFIILFRHLGLVPGVQIFLYWFRKF